jgi:hypothetical protein
MNTYFSIHTIILLPIVCFAYNLSAQVNESTTEPTSIPISIFVENSVFVQPVAGATVELKIRENYGQGNILEETIGKFQTDERGYCTMSLLPNKTYMLSVRREGFFSQLSMLHTADFSRLKNNKTKISLRPRDLLTIRGQIISDQTTPIEGVVSLIDKKTMAERTDAIAVDGTYKIQGIKGEDYQLHVVVEGLMDTLVDVVDLKEEIFRGEMSFLFDIPLEKEEEVIIKPDYVMGDSVTLPKLKFIGKTAELVDKEWVKMFAAELAKNNLTKIELHVHTSSRKSHRFNILLAKKRAISLESVFTEQKVPEKQTEIMALGEVNPINRCGRGCSEEEHAANSRVVLVVKEGELYLDQ